MAQKFPTPLNTLIAHLKKLPGVGSRTASRFAFELLTWEAPQLEALSATLKTLKTSLPPCQECGCITDQASCTFCNNKDTSTLCIIGSARDAYALEETLLYKGLYHVIEHLISPLDGRSIEMVRVDKIEKRIQQHNIKELIIALDSTLEGDATALYLKNSLSHLNLSISRLAFGLPVGHSLEYVDGGTLAKALLGRHQL